MVPPRQAAALLRAAGLRTALVSSSNDEGTQKLWAEAPDIVVPVLRPYRTRADTGAWVREDAIVRYMEERLARYRYPGVGVFHPFGADSARPVPRRMGALARERSLFLPPPRDAAGVVRLVVHLEEVWEDDRIQLVLDARNGRFRVVLPGFRKGSPLPGSLVD